MILKPTPYYPDTTFVFTLHFCDLLKRAFVKTIKPKSLSSKIFYNHRSTNNNLIYAFVTLINGIRVLTSADSLKQLNLLHEKGVLEFSLTFAPENKLTYK